MDRTATSNGVTDYDIIIVTRAAWGARGPKATTPLTLPVDKVIVHHTDMARCHNFDECVAEMRKIQDFHMDTRGWDDIGYHFLVGEDGCVYEARGWNRQGAHTKGWNDVSVGISVMGDFQKSEPDTRALETAKLLIRRGVKEGYIKPDYKLYGHRKMNPNTTCPGDLLYAQIKSWPHFDNQKPVHPTKPHLYVDDV